MRILHNYSKDCVVGISPRELLDRARAEQRRSEPDRPSQKSARQLRVAEIDRLVARYEKVRNIRRVATEFKMSRTTIAKHLADRRVATTKSMSTEQIARAVELYADGLSSIVIGKQLGFDNHTIINALRQVNVQIRPQLGRM